MTYDFYASKTDKLQLLAYLFEETDLQVFDSYSAYGEKVKQYRSVVEIEQSFDLENGQSTVIAFQVWSPSFLGPMHFEKVTLDPKYCRGHTFRYRTSGWGLIQLYLGGVDQQQLYASHLGHMSEKRALAWQATAPNLGLAQQWDWKAIGAIARRLQYLLHQKWAVQQVGSRGVLQGAERMQQQGVKLKE